MDSFVAAAVTVVADAVTVASAPDAVSDASAASLLHLSLLFGIQVSSPVSFP